MVQEICGISLASQFYQYTILYQMTSKVEIAASIILAKGNVKYDHVMFSCLFKKCRHISINVICLHYLQLVSQLITDNAFKCAAHERTCRPYLLVLTSWIDKIVLERGQHLRHQTSNMFDIFRFLKNSRVRRARGKYARIGKNLRVRAICRIILKTTRRMKTTSSCLKLYQKVNFSICGKFSCPGSFMYILIPIIMYILIL